MSFDDTKCPCGGMKQREMLLCATCETSLEEHPSMRVFRDATYSPEGRRQAAIILLACARRRHHHQQRTP